MLLSLKTIQLFYSIILLLRYYRAFLTFRFRFRYKFKANTIGSMFYHSHSQFQRGDGLFGPYIVRTAAELDPNWNEYDFDLTGHYIHVQEWFHKVRNINKIIVRTFLDYILRIIHTVKYYFTVLYFSQLGKHFYYIIGILVKTRRTIF